MKTKTIIAGTSEAMHYDVTYKGKSLRLQHLEMASREDVNEQIEEINAREKLGKEMPVITKNLLEAERDYLINQLSCSDTYECMQYVSGQLHVINKLLKIYREDKDKEK